MANSFAPDTLRQAILSQKIRESHGPSTRPFIECGTICQLRREASDLNVSQRRPVRVISQPATDVRFGSRPCGRSRLCENAHEHQNAQNCFLSFLLSTV